MLLRCGDPEGEGGEGGARAGVRCPRSDSPVAEVDGTAGEATAAAEEVGRFWKYCSPGSSSSSAPQGYTCGRPMVGSFYKQAHSNWVSTSDMANYVGIMTRNMSDLLQLQLQRPVALWHHSRPRIQDHAEVWLG